MFNKDIQVKIDEAIERLKSTCLEVSHFLSDNPEISGEEEKSCLYICEFLKKQGYEVTTPLKNVAHSFLAIDPKKKHDKKIAIFCEYDALPDIGHACGHSLSCAMSLLAALAIKEALADFPMQIDIIGTPAEELGGGKILLADAGAFDGYEFGAMAHLFGTTNPFFKVIASCDMEVKFFGKSAHASVEPWEGKNALNGLMLFYHALDMLRQHLVPGCQIHGVVTNGGILPSIVPEEATCYFYPRAASIKELDVLWDRMENCAKGAALATETTCEVKMLYNKYGDIYIGPKNKDLLLNIFDNLAIDFVKEETAFGSTDAGNVDVIMPTYHPGIGIGNDPEIKLHSKEFAELVRSDAAEQSLIEGARVIASICSTLAYDEQLLSEIQAEHRKHRQG